MFKNYFKTAWRNLIKDKQFSLLNLLGLSTGLACVLLICLWVNDELSIDKFNENDNQLYQVLKRNPDGTGSIQVSEITQGLLGESMAKEFPEVEFATCIRKEREPGILFVNDKEIKAQPEFVSKDFFHVFSYEIINGNKENALSNISDILLSDVTAVKLFNTTNVVGKTIKWSLKEAGVDFSNIYTVTGVFKASRSNASDQFDVLFPFDLYANKMAGGMGDVTFWGSNMASTYLLLKPNTNITAFNNKIEDYTKAKIGALYAGKGFEQYEGELFIQKYSDRYLYNNFENGVQSGGRIDYVKLFSAIAIFILIIACINFMNLSTAKASRRMKEVGVKKVVGASRSSLIFQYISESTMMAFLSLLMAVVIVILLLPAFREITGKQITLQFSTNFIVSAIIITIITGLIAGSYPAFYLSRFKPVSIQKAH